MGKRERGKGAWGERSRARENLCKAEGCVWYVCDVMSCARVLSLAGEGHECGESGGTDGTTDSRGVGQQTLVSSSPLPLPLPPSFPPSLPSPVFSLPLSVPPLLLPPTYPVSNHSHKWNGQSVANMYQNIKLTSPTNALYPSQGWRRVGSLCPLATTPCLPCVVGSLAGPW